MTSLQLAGNPYHNNYTVKYAVSVAPAVKYGDHIFDFFGNTYPGLYELVANDGGYKYSWQSGWIDPITGLPGQQLVLQNLLGTTDRDAANSLSPISDAQVQALATKGTAVKLIVGTNDGFMPISLEVEYYNKLVSNNVPVELNLIYRGGHNWSLDKEAILKNLMQYHLKNLHNKMYQSKKMNFRKRKKRILKIMILII